MPLCIQRVATVYMKDSKAKKDITGHLCMFSLQALALL